MTSGRTHSALIGLHKISEECLSNRRGDDAIQSKYVAEVTDVAELRSPFDNAPQFLGASSVFPSIKLQSAYRIVLHRTTRTLLTQIVASQ